MEQGQDASETTECRQCSDEERRFPRSSGSSECLEPFDNESMFRFFLGSSSDERQLPCCTEDDTKQDVATTTEETNADLSESCRQCSDEEGRAGR